MNNSQTDSRNGAPDPQLTPAADYQVSVVDIAFVLVKRRRQVAAITLAIVVLVAAVAFLIPATYRSTAKILPIQQNVSASSALIDQMMSMGGLGSSLPYKTPADLYVTLLQVDPVLDAIVKDHDLKRVYRLFREKSPSEARAVLGDHTDITASKEGVVSITVADRDPKRAASIANDYVAQLSGLCNRVAITDASRRRASLEKQLAKTRDELTKAEMQMRDIQKSTGIIALDPQAKSVIEAVATLRARIATTEVALEAMQSYTTAQNPDRVRAEQELSALRRQLANFERGTGGDQSNSVQGMPDSALDYIRRAREVRMQEAVLAALTRQYESAKLDESSDNVLIQVLQPATEPDRKSGPQRGFIIITAAVLGVVFACGYAFLKERRSHLWKVDSVDAARLQEIRQMLSNRTQVDSQP